MPPRSTKTYTIATGPGAPSSTPVPANPLRIGLFIQNTSANAGTSRLGTPVQGNGSDMLFAAGASQKWDQAETCPLESVNLSSAALVTWCVIETISGK